MEKVVSNKMTIYAVFSISLFLLNSMIYVMFGKDNNLDWWAFDKLNDRFVVVNLLFITSFIFRDYIYRLFVYVAMLFIVIYACYECAYIYGQPINEGDFVIIAMLYWGLSTILLMFIYVAKRNA